MKINLLLFLCLLQFALAAQTTERYSSVRISLIGKQMADLVRTGIETEHGTYFPGRSITVVLSTKELERVRNAGFETEILIADLQQEYLEQRAHPQPAQLRGGSCVPSTIGHPDYVTPANYSYGTMGGYLTYEQMMAELDKMHALYPNLISARHITSDTILTWEGRPIYYVKISDNPDVDEPERQVLYTALHHAREPNSASQLIFYMWYLLENYATRPDIQAIVNNLELYFVPCMNVDGYIFNETNSPNGGGFWRKNRRNNGDGTYGIDLNRNYGYFWGDFGGSSPDPGSEIYRGPEAFSEPETRTIRDFCLAHDFLFVYNCHTSGNLFIYPWAYSDSPADSAFIKYARYFTRESNYHFGTTSETVGYSVNGSSDDWMYAEKGSYSYTPEIGTTGFWPQQNEIDGLNKDNLWQDLSMAYSALRYGEATDLTLTNLSALSGNLKIELMRYGLMDGPLQISITPFSSNIVSPSVAKSFDIGNLTKALYEPAFELDPAIHVGDEVDFIMETSNGFWSKRDTLRKIYAGNGSGAPLVDFQDDLSSTDNWVGGWFITNETYHSAPSCMTDSPNGLYAPNTSIDCISLDIPTIPANAVNANLRFFAKWDIEADWDWVYVKGVGDNYSRKLCGLYTEPSVGTQEEGPVYDGTQSDWVEECMDISDFIGQPFNVIFNFTSDGAVEADGFFFDDLRIEYTLPVSGTQTIELTDFRLSQNEPNPAADYTFIQWAKDKNVLAEKANLLVFNMLGQLVIERPVNLKTEKGVALDTHHLAPGIYTYLLRNEQGQTPAIKMIVQH